jgi:NhaP-type Na+/H+ or K+/H+ antiporter
MFFPFFSLIVGALIAHFGSKLPIPYTVILLVVGLIIGFCITVLHAHSDFAVSATVFAGIDPHMMLFLFLPPLLFESAFNIKWHVFKKTAGAAVLLATSGVVIASIFAAVCVKGMFYPSWDWTMGKPTYYLCVLV